MTAKRQLSAFEKYAHEYDVITNAAQREKYHQKEVDALIARFHPKSVLDAGCVSGLTVMLFARRGIAAVGLDRSRRMIEVAQKKFKNVDSPLEFRWGDFECLPKKLHKNFDLVVCLANSISGVNTLAGLKRSLKSFCAVLKPGGQLALGFTARRVLSFCRTRLLLSIDRGRGSWPCSTAFQISPVPISTRTPGCSTTNRILN